MKKVVGVNFRENGRTYFFNPNSLELKIGDQVIVETKMGQEFGKIKILNREIDETKLKEPLKDVIKIATRNDIKHQEENIQEENKASDIFKKKLKEYNLSMNLVETRYLFDNSKLIFYFTAENRVDFRELVKDLASIFRTRIELRQISIRDQVKLLGGNGICGLKLCCCSFLKEFDGVSIKMAKEQNLSLNTSKITGNCGRLMCCLKYEQNVYEEKMKKLPHIGAIVKTESGEGTVDGVEVLKEIITVKLKDEEGNTYKKKYNMQEITIIKDNKNTEEHQEKMEEQEIRELEQIEAMDKKEQKNASIDDDI